MKLSVLANLYGSKPLDEALKIISSLGERERLIMTMRFGIGGGREYTQKEVALILGISQSYISRIEKKVIKRLKLHLE